MMIQQANSPPLVRILIADDSAMIRKRLFNLLGNLPGVQIVGQAENVRQAVALVQLWTPDLVTLDIQMPSAPGLKNGIDVLRRIKQEQPLTQVIMLTNLVQSPYRTKCLAAGADYFFDKSNEFDCVAPVVAQVRQGTQQARPS